MSTFGHATQAADWLREHGCGDAAVAIVLGSGLGDFADQIAGATSIPYDEIGRAHV